MRSTLPWSEHICNVCMSSSSCGPSAAVITNAVVVHAPGCQADTKHRTNMNTERRGATINVDMYVAHVLFGIGKDINACMSQRPSTVSALN